MSGITGYSAIDGRNADEAVLDRMLDAISFRGPDGIAGAVSGPSALGQARLFATDEEEGDPQPVIDPQSGAMLTADVRLDNRDELARTLNREPGVSDARLLLAAWDRWGERSPEHLRGDFAFVLYDPRNRILFGARDQMGVRPFVYFHRDPWFVFGSQAAAVLAHPGVPGEVSRERVADYYTGFLEGLDHHSTFFRHIIRLPPAHAFKLDDRSLQVWRYWSLSAPTPLRLKDEREYAEAFREVFQGAVDRRLRGGSRVGAMLSGGLDSSSVVAVARDRRKASGLGPLPTFSGVTAAGTRCPERKCIEAMIAQGGLDPVVLPPAEAIDAMPSADAIVAGCDDPFDFSMLVPGAMYQAARSRGLRVMLDGVDGDLVCSLSTRWWLYLIRRGRLVRLGREVMDQARRWGSFRWSLRLAAECALPALLPRPLARKVRQHHFDGKISEKMAGLELPDWLGDIDVASRIRRFLDTELPFPEPPDITGRQITVLTNPFVAGHLERYDRVAARHGIEARHPFYDLKVLEFCLSLPSDQLIHRGWEKWPLRSALDPPLPSEIQWRRDRTNPAGDYHLAFSGSRGGIDPADNTADPGLMERWLAANRG